LIAHSSFDDLRFRRILICTPDADDRFLASAARIAALMPAADLHVVASTAQCVLDRLPEAVAAAFGRGAGRIRVQLVPEPSMEAFYRLAHDEGADLLVVPSAWAVRRARRTRSSVAPCSILVLPDAKTADKGSGVVALVNWEDGAATLAIAADLASRMRTPHVTACHVYFDEAAIVSDQWERREAERRRDALDLLVARVPCGEVAVETRVIQCPSVQRALTHPRMPGDFDLLVTTEPLDVPGPMLRLQFAIAEPSPRERRWFLRAGVESGRA
jgi:hypothetical protein